MKTLTSSSILAFYFALIFSLSWADSCKTFLECLIHHSKHSTPISKVIFTPKNSSYTSILQLGLRNLRFASSEIPKPLVIVTPLHESHIQTVIHCARKRRIQIRIRCGGHDFEGISYMADVPFVMIDMINLQAVNVDPESTTAWIQGGGNTGEVYYRIAENSNKLGFPGGVRGTVGVSVVEDMVRWYGNMALLLTM